MALLLVGALGAPTQQLPAALQVDQSTPDAINASAANVSAAEPAEVNDLWDVGGGKACSDGTCWPTLFLMGVQKAATTSLFMELSNHNKVCGANVHEGPIKECADCNTKETHFFTTQRTAGGKTIHMSHHEYKKMYHEKEMLKKGCGHFMEGTPMLQEKGVGAAIAATLPKNVHHMVRMIVILREPLSRDLSWYNHQLDDYKRGVSHKFNSEYPTPPSYKEYAHDNLEAGEKCLEKHPKDCGLTHDYTLSWGMYYPQLKAIQSHWERKHIFIVKMDHLLEETKGTMSKMNRFMGISGSAPRKLPKENSHDGPWKVDSMPCKTKKRMTEYYHEWNEKLYKMMERDRADGKHPADEPKFGKFENEVTCH